MNIQLFDRLLGWCADVAALSAERRIFFVYPTQRFFEIQRQGRGAATHHPSAEEQP